MIKGLPVEAARQIVTERQSGGPYRDLSDCKRRLRLSQSVLTILADADALQSLARDRRAAIWQSLAQEKSSKQMPLLDDASEADELIPEQLLPMQPIEEVHADYRTTGLSLKAHPISFLREELRRRGCVSAAELASLRDGRHVRFGGLVLLRQRPGTAKGVTFATLEDETGPINVVLFAKVWQRFFRVAKTSHAWLVEGKLENQKGVIHVVVSHIEDLRQELGDLAISSRDFR